MLNPTGLCGCGCGQHTPIAQKTDRRAKQTKGEPLCFIHGHFPPRVIPEEPRACECGCGELTAIFKGRARRFRTGHNAVVRRITEVDYAVEDRGYETPCWIWQRHIRPSGYGQVTTKGQKMIASRAMYEQEVGPIPEGLEIDHLCYVPSCIRPDHLEPVTRLENMRRYHAHSGPRRRLSDKQIANAQMLYTNGIWSTSRLAARFEVSATTMRGYLRLRLP